MQSGNYCLACYALSCFYGTFPVGWVCGWKTKTKQNSQLVEFGLSLEKILPLMKFPRFGPVDKNHQFPIFMKIHHCRKNYHLDENTSL